MKRLGNALAITFSTLIYTASAYADPNVSALEALGKQVFFDKISVPKRQACASCHVPASGWTATVAAVNMGQVAVTGANPHAIGGRKPPTVAYAAFAPHFDDSGLCSDLALGCSGGIFWDGRATGFGIGNEVFPSTEYQEAYGEFLGPTADQAMGPFANTAEQNVDWGSGELPGSVSVCEAVANSKYAPLFAQAWGSAPDCATNPDLEFKRIAVAISAWEHSDEVNSFSSKRDRVIAGDAEFTEQESAGRDLFYGQARCVACHNGTGFDEPVTDAGGETFQLYTDNSFHNIGVPANYDIANFNAAASDVGLAGVTGNPAHVGAFRTPPLRNVDQRFGKGFVKAYMHNGYFKSLEQVVHFYNTAAIKPPCDTLGMSAAEAMSANCWPLPENDVGRPPSFIVGDLGLSIEQESALVAYLKTLSDAVVPTATNYKK